MSVDPISEVDFAALLTAQAMDDDVTPLVACSGGPDSMALTFLCDRWARAQGGQARVVVVDHGLRPEARDEAISVARSLRRYEIQAAVLHHDGPKPVRDIQAAAREIRFRLIGSHAAAIGTDRVFLAHHRDDQAETLLLRLARGSGVDGLAAMAPMARRDGLTVCRPLLDVPKARLSATLEAAGWPAVTDPSNADRAFARVRLRGLSAALAREGLTPRRLADTARRMARARTALNAARDAFLIEHVACSPAGFARFSPESLEGLSDEIALRVLAHLTRILGGRDHPPREARVTALLKALRSGTSAMVRDERGAGLKGGRTLAGCRVLPWRSDILVCREAAAMAAPVPAVGRHIWDGRFVAEFKGQASDFHLGALGQAGLGAAKTWAGDAVSELPGPVRPTLPALWYGDELAAIPHLGVAGRDGAPMGTIGFRPVSEAWGDEFRARLTFSNPIADPI